VWKIRRGVGRSHEELGLKSPEGNAKRQNLGCGVGGSMRQTSRAAGMTAGFSS